MKPTCPQRYVEESLKIDAVADQFVVLETPALFRSVGEFFREFDPVSDEAAAALLRAHGQGSPSYLKSPAPWNA